MLRIVSSRTLAATLVVLGAVLAALVLLPARGTYIFLPNRAHPVEPLVRVEGERPTGPGGIFFVDIRVRRATLLERLFPSVRTGSTLVPEEHINPTGISEKTRHRANLREMSRSQRIAAAVALRELGYTVKARPAGALIDAVLPNAPAAGKLQPTDVVVAVDGNRVRTPADLRGRLRARPPGTTRVLRVRRGRELIDVTIETVADPEDARRAVIGVLANQAADIELPIRVRIDAGDIGGPSAGLAFALDLLDELGRDVDRGYRVAVTGAIELDGGVTSIGGVKQKAIGAERSDVDVFVVPAGENAVEARRYAEGLRVIAVDSFQQALRELATLPRKAKSE